MTDYYAHDHTQSAQSNPDVVPVSSRYTRIDGVGGTSHVHEGVTQVVGGPTMRPYEPPKPPKREKLQLVHCANEGCKAFPMKGLEYCASHARSMGLKP